MEKALGNKEEGKIEEEIKCDGCGNMYIKDEIHAVGRGDRLCSDCVVITYSYLVEFLRKR